MPYRADATVQRGVKVTREVFRATNELARAHGATPLLVVLQFGDGAARAGVRRQILDDAGFPYMVIEIDPAWRLPWNRHPDARAARAIAVAIAAELRDRLAQGPVRTYRPSRETGRSAVQSEVHRSVPRNPHLVSNPEQHQIGGSASPPIEIMPPAALGRSQRRAELLLNQSIWSTLHIRGDVPGHGVILEMWQATGRLILFGVHF